MAISIIMMVDIWLTTDVRMAKDHVEVRDPCRTRRDDTDGLRTV